MGRYSVILLVLGTVLAVWAGAYLAPSVKRDFLGGGVAEEALDQADFQAACVEVANGWRRQFEVRELEGDEEVQAALRRLVEGLGEGELVSLPQVFSHVQQFVPAASSLSASVSYAPDLEGLKKQLSEWDDIVIDEYDYLSTWLIVDGRRLGCVTVLAQKIPPFSLDRLAQGGGAFFNECSRCGDRHAVELRDLRRTIVLSCPGCKQEYDLIAYDSTGRYRRAPDFLDRFALPRAADSEEGSLEEVYRIWSAVREKCDYEYDGAASPNLTEERWQLPGETYASGRGDCEDTSILLADALISAGYPARVAIGRNRRVGEHAWCVVRVDGEQYLLETTGGKPTEAVIPKVSEEGEYYLPRQLFDREAIYFRTEVGDSADYWSDEAWARVVIGEEGGAAPVARR
ncbi:MAG: transglutaminase-like domain-containing protein [Verrucomicrobiota bacterium]